MASKRELLCGELTDRIIGAFFQVHYELGPGFLEAIYARAMAIVLADLGMHVQREVPLAVHFRGRQIGFFRADMVVERLVLVEFKAGKALDPTWEAQLINNLSAIRLEVGLSLFFGAKPVVKRKIFTNDRKLLAPDVLSEAP